MDELFSAPEGRAFPDAIQGSPDFGGGGAGPRYRSDGSDTARGFAVCKSIATLKAMRLRYQKRYEMFARFV